MNAFIIGSHAYGTPTKDSDVDLVIKVTGATASRLKSLSDKAVSHLGDRSIRFGRLNLIVCQSDTELACWKVATDIMVTSGEKYDRVEAKKVLDEIRAKLGLLDQHQSGDLRKEERHPEPSPKKGVDDTYDDLKPGNLKPPPKKKKVSPD